MLFRRVQTGIEKLQKKASEGNIPSPLLCKKEFYLGKFEGGLINKCRALCVVQRERERERVCVCVNSFTLTPQNDMQDTTTISPCMYM
jgi:hypothetical protein